jgi:hypothetical protein
VQRLGLALTQSLRRSLALSLALAAAWLLPGTAASAASPPVLTPSEVRSTPTQFIVVAVANPVTGRPGAVGGTAHGYGSSTSYRVSASATSTLLPHEIASSDGQSMKVSVTGG